MTTIFIKKMSQVLSTGWKALVEVQEENLLSYSVELDKAYWQELTGGKEKPEDLIKRSFEFLLEREPKESILKEFNLKIIEKYFPEYREVIKVN